MHRVLHASLVQFEFLNCILVFERDERVHRAAHRPGLGVTQQRPDDRERSVRIVVPERGDGRDRDRAETVQIAEAGERFRESDAFCEAEVFEAGERSATDAFVLGVVAEGTLEERERGSVPVTTGEFHRVRGDLVGPRPIIEE